MPPDFSACAILLGRWPCLENCLIYCAPSSRHICKQSPLQLLVFLQTSHFSATGWAKQKQNPTNYSHFASWKILCQRKQMRSSAHIAPNSALACLYACTGAILYFSLSVPRLAHSSLLSNPGNTPRWSELSSAVFGSPSLGAMPPSPAPQAAVLYSKASLSRDQHGWGGGGITKETKKKPYGPTPSDN